MFAFELLEIKSTVYNKTRMRLKWFPTLKFHNRILKTHTNEGPRVCSSACLLLMQKSKGLRGGRTASASRPSVLLARDCCVAMETPVERGFYESFSNPLFLPTAWDLFITHTTYKTFHTGEGIRSPVKWSKCCYRWSIQRRFGDTKKKKKVSGGINGICDEKNAP